MLATSEYYSRSILGATMMLMGIALVPAIATAPMPPQLVLAKLNGRSIHVLDLTRSKDLVLVRCYPGQQPSVVAQDKPDSTKEGTLTCVN